MSSPIFAHVIQTTGIIELRRPQALNALNPEMIALIRQALESWRDDERVTQVLIYAPERSFCAGGDVRAMRELHLEGKAEQADAFFRQEYEVNHLIATYPKPYAALIDGVVMGGGLGISAHGTYRLITDNAFASMPEMAIGFVTDVGMTKVLQDLTGRAMGRFLALTGYRLNAADMLFTGVATHKVSSADPEAFICGALEPPTVEDAPLASMVPDIEATFDFDTWEEIDAALQAHPNEEFVSVTRELLASASPHSLQLTAALLADNAETDLRTALENEFEAGRIARAHPDFVEGVRAVLVDKTRDAQFKSL